MHNNHKSAQSNTARMATRRAHLRSGTLRPRALAAAVALAVAGLGAVPAAGYAATLTWDGGAIYSFPEPLPNWGAMNLDPSNLSYLRTNWSGLLNLPANGDLLQFGSGPLFYSFNDISSLSLAGLRFLPGAASFTLDGNGITVGAQGIVNASSVIQTINMPVINGTAGSLFDGGIAGLAFNGPVSFSESILNVYNKVQINNPTLRLGGAASNATLWVRPGAILSTKNIQVGSAGRGLLWVDEAKLQVSDVLSVGHSGEGGLSIGSGAIVSSVDSYIGEQSNAIGVASVDGAGASWNSSRSLTVGLFGSGTLNIRNHGSVTTAFGTVGYASGTTGIVTVTGAGSTWSGMNQLIVGRSGNGTLNINNGGTVSASESNVGFSNGSTGAVTVAGAGSTFNAGQLYVAWFGAGTLEIKTGGTVTSTSGRIGHNSSQAGNILVTGAGSKWNVANDLYVGYGTIGNLDLREGGTVTSKSGIAGGAEGSRGTVTINGAGSAWTSPEITIGYVGSGFLAVQNGGTVSSDLGYLGRNPLGTGVATVTGAGSAWNTSLDLIVGLDGAGTLDVQNGGLVAIGRQLRIGQHGVVNLAGGTLQAQAPTIDAGGRFNWTAGTLRLTGATVAMGSGPLIPGVTVLEAGKTLWVDNTLTVGNNLLLLAGGNVRAGVLTLSGGQIAATAGSVLDMNLVGTLSGNGGINASVVNGAGSTVRASGGTLTLGNANASGGFVYGGSLEVGTNQVILLSADKAALGSSTTMGEGARLATVNGANLASGRALTFTGNASVLGNFTNNGTVSGTGGTLTFLNDVNGAGSFSGNVAFHAGYSPGNSPATVNHNGGDVTFDSTSLLTMEILGPTPGTQYDQLVGINTLTFNGRLSVVFGNGFAPTAGSNFRLFSFNTFAGSLASDRIDVTGFDRTQLDFSHLAQDGSFTVAAVPEPGTYAMFAAGLGLMGLMVRRRRRVAPA